MHSVIDADRLGDRKLHAGEEVAQHRPCREADDDAGDAGRGEQRDAYCARLERHQREADGTSTITTSRTPLKNADLRHVLARQQVVRRGRAENA